MMKKKLDTLEDTLNNTAKKATKGKTNKRKNPKKKEEQKPLSEKERQQIALQHIKQLLARKRAV